MPRPQGTRAAPQPMPPRDPTAPPGRRPGPAAIRAIVAPSIELDAPGMAPILHAAAAGNSSANADASPEFPAAFGLDNRCTSSCSTGELAPRPDSFSATIA